MVGHAKIQIILQNNQKVIIISENGKQNNLENKEQIINRLINEI